PKVPWMAWATLPTGAPPPPPFMIFQNIEWFMCPPPLLRTAVRIDSGTMAQLLARSSSTVLLARSGADSRALFRLVTYALWCFPWWISMVILSMWGSSTSGAYGSGGSVKGISVSFLKSGFFENVGQPKHGGLVEVASQNLHSCR